MVHALVGETSFRDVIRTLLHVLGIRKTGIAEVTPEELYRRIEGGHTPLMIDIRPPGEYDGTGGDGKGHIPDAVSISYEKLESSLGDLEAYKDKEVVTMCPRGGLSLVAAELMTKAGFKDVKSLKGGMESWNRKGYPTTRDQ